MLWYQWLLSHDWPTDDIRRLAHLDDRNTRGGVRRDGATCSCRLSTPRRRWSWEATGTKADEPVCGSRGRATDPPLYVCVADFNRVQEVHRDREEDARRDPGSAAEDECYNALAQTVGKESQGCVVGTHGCCGLAGSLRVRTGCRRSARTRPRMTRPAPGRSWWHRAINCSPLCPRRPPTLLLSVPPASGPAGAGGDTRSVKNNPTSPLGVGGLDAIFVRYQLLNLTSLRGGVYPSPNPSPDVFRRSSRCITTFLDSFFGLLSWFVFSLLA